MFVLLLSVSDELRYSKLWWRAFYVRRAGRRNILIYNVQCRFCSCALYMVLKKSGPHFLFPFAVRSSKFHSTLHCNVIQKVQRAGARIFFRKSNRQHRHRILLFSSLHWLFPLSWINSLDHWALPSRFSAHHPLDRRECKTCGPWVKLWPPPRSTCCRRRKCSPPVSSSCPSCRMSCVYSV